MGYRVLGELFGGILGGLGLGWVVDRFAGTGPWGMIVGVLAGLVLAVLLVVRSAGRMDGTPSGAPDIATGPAVNVQAPSGSEPDDS